VSKGFVNSCLAMVMIVNGQYRTRLQNEINIVGESECGQRHLGSHGEGVICPWTQ
jgi:hypothetical protein